MSEPTAPRETSRFARLSLDSVAACLPDHATVSLLELGGAVIGLALLARLGSRLGFSAIPLYLIAGLAFGRGGLAPLKISHSFIETGGGIGVLLLLFMLGLEYSGQQLLASLRGSYKAGALGILLNFSPGVIAGLLLGWSPLAAVLLGGITYNSSSGIVARILADAAGERRPEVPFVLSIVVFEDLAMAVYLPLVAVLLVGGGALRLAASVSIALVTVTLVLLFAVRFGNAFSRVVMHESTRWCCSRRLEQFCWWPVSPSGCRSLQRLAHF